jgi:hypothetical protein
MKVLVLVSVDFFSRSESLWFKHMGRGIALSHSALPFPGTEVIDVLRCGSSLWWYRTLKIVAQLLDGRRENYLLKVYTPSSSSFRRALTFPLQIASIGSNGKKMCEGEYESLKALHAVSPTLAPRPYTVDDIFGFHSPAKLTRRASSGAAIKEMSQKCTLFSANFER